MKARFFEPALPSSREMSRSDEEISKQFEQIVELSHIQLSLRKKAYENFGEMSETDAVRYQDIDKQLIALESTFNQWGEVWQEKLKRLKEDVIQEMSTFISSIDEPRHKEVSRMAIEYGVERLYHLLHEIQFSFGQLPRVMVFPETSTRTIMYGVFPLLRRVYEEMGQEYPLIQHVKTWVKIEREDDRKEVLKEIQKKRVDLLQKKEQLLEFRAVHLRAMKGKKTSHPTWNELSQKTQALTQQIDRLKQEVWMLDDQMDFIKREKFREVLRERLSAIEKQTVGGPLLVIDDLMGDNARTTKQLFEAGKKIGLQQRTVFFQFFGNPLVQSESSVPLDQISSGASYVKFPSNARRVGKRVYFDFQKDVTREGQPLDWDVLSTKGFWDRKNKQAVTGVTKDISSSSVVVRSLHGVKDEMRTVRAEYARWGTEAVQHVYAKRYESLQSPSLQDFIQSRQIRSEHFDTLVFLASIPKNTIVMDFHNYFNSAREDSARRLKIAMEREESVEKRGVLSAFLQIVEAYQWQTAYNLVRVLEDVNV